MRLLSTLVLGYLSTSSLAARNTTWNGLSGNRSYSLQVSEYDAQRSSFDF